MNKLRLVSESRDESALRALLSSQDVGFRSDRNTVKDSDTITSRLSTLDAPKLLQSEVLNSERSSHSEAEKYEASRKTKASQVSFPRKIFLYCLQKYFLLSRPLTMGARCIVINDKREVLLIKHTYIEGWHIPGGGIDAGESAESAMQRELIEETMLQISGPLKLVGIYHCSTYSKRDHVVVFLSQEFKKIRDEQSLEIAECRFFPLDNLPVDTDKDTAAWISDALGSSEKKSLII